MRHDMEVYMGVYVTLGIFLGVSSIIIVLLYWQIMRMRYLMSSSCQQAFYRFDQSATEMMGHRFCPGFVATVYDKVRGFLKG